MTKVPQLTPFQKDFLVEEYCRLNELILTGWRISYTILTGAVMLFGVLFAQVPWVTGNDFTTNAFLLILLPTVLALIFGQIISSMNMACSRQIEIADEFNIPDFWTQWVDNVKSFSGKHIFYRFLKSGAAGSFPFAIVLYLGAILSFLLIFTTEKSPSWLRWTATVITLINIILIHWRLNPYFQQPKESPSAHVHKLGPDSNPPNS